MNNGNTAEKIEIDDVTINHLLAVGITDPKVIDLVIKIDRKKFLPTEYQTLAYSDGALYFSKNKFMIDINAVANMLLLIKQPIKKALVINSGLGYGSSIISQIASEVIGVDEDDSMVNQAKNNLSQLQINNVEILKDNLKELNNIKEEFDLIFVEGAFESIPNKWIDILKNNGILVGVERERNISKVVKVIKIEDRTIKTEYAKVATPCIQGLEKSEGFNFN